MPASSSSPHESDIAAPSVLPPAQLHQEKQKAQEKVAASLHSPQPVQSQEIVSDIASDSRDHASDQVKDPTQNKVDASDSSPKARTPSQVIKAFQMKKIPEDSH
ncbi:hypothetical protein U1Q18_052861 [Sarracenia purpurea var. burkii]